MQISKILPKTWCNQNILKCRRDAMSICMRKLKWVKVQDMHLTSSWLEANHFNVEKLEIPFHEIWMEHEDIFMMCAAYWHLKTFNVTFLQCSFSSVMFFLVFFPSSKLFTRHPSFADIENSYSFQVCCCYYTTHSGIGKNIIWNFDI